MRTTPPWIASSSSSESTEGDQCFRQWFKWHKDQSLHDLIENKKCAMNNKHNVYENDYGD